MRAQRAGSLPCDADSAGIVRALKITVGVLRLVAIGRSAVGLGRGLSVHALGSPVDGAVEPGGCASRDSVRQVARSREFAW